MNKKVVCVFIVIIIIFAFLFFTVKNRKSENSKGNEVVKRELNTYNDKDFNIKLIKTINSGYKSNYLISPYSIEIALNMLREGSSNVTKEEIDNVISKRDITDVTNDKVKVANAIFVKDIYKDYIKEEFYNVLKEKYSSEILYDKFTTPKIINNWVNKNTDGMIDKILEKIDKDFVLGLSNAVAIDVEWENKFECINTTEEAFTKIDDSNINVEMMHKTYSYGGAKYFSNNNSKGIILPYNNGLEFVGILPNESIDKYVSSLTEEALKNIDKNTTEASSDVHILLSMPRFSYSFNLDNFKDILKNIGIKEVFSENSADLTNIISRENMRKLNIDNMYVSDAIHKTYIDLNEKGTKAAAVTYFGIAKATAIAPTTYKEIKIEFDKPFIYMIRDVSSKEILFFGSVYEPNIWNGSTCSEE